jgi:hypothetical protein
MKSSRLFKYGFFALLVAVAGASTYVWKNFISPPWEEEYAYSKGMQAAIYTFPYVLNSSLRWAWSQSAEQVGNSAVPSDAINNFYHSPRLTTADYRDGGTPNNDTAYSVTWAYAKTEPLIISIPEMGVIPNTNKPRYYSFELASFASDNFAYIGTRTTGNQAGNYAIVPAGWQGTLPADVTLLAQTPTPWFLILGRTLVVDQEDFAAVSKLISGYKLTALSDWGNLAAKRPYAPVLEPVAHYKQEKLELFKQYWSIANKALTENPPIAADARLMSFYRDINVAPGLEVSQLDEGMRNGMARAALRALLLLPQVNNSSYGTTLVNGWKYPPKDFGRSGVSGQFLVRAAIQSLGGIVANDPAEAVYLPAMRDLQGNLLVGKNRYKITFAKDRMPPVNSFWSLTMYDSTNNLAANKIDRYSLGDRSTGLSYAADGSLTLYVGQQEPAAEHLSNWLPAPDDEFYLVLRTYLPKSELIQQSWQPPMIESVETY